MTYLRYKKHFEQLRSDLDEESEKKYIFPYDDDLKQMQGYSGQKTIEVITDNRSDHDSAIRKFRLIQKVRRFYLFGQVYIFPPKTQFVVDNELVH